MLVCERRVILLPAWSASTNALIWTAWGGGEHLEEWLPWHLDKIPSSHVQ